MNAKQLLTPEFVSSCFAYDAGTYSPFHSFEEWCYVLENETHGDKLDKLESISERSLHWAFKKGLSAAQAAAHFGLDSK